MGVGLGIGIAIGIVIGWKWRSRCIQRYIRSEVGFANGQASYHTHPSSKSWWHGVSNTLELLKYKMRDGEV